MTKEEIKQIIPHRDAMLLLDEVEQEEDTAVGTLRIRGDEWFLQGHFPGNPVVPGVILCEILAQSSCILLKDVMTEGKLPFYTGMNNVPFPGEAGRHLYHPLPHQALQGPLLFCGRVRLCGRKALRTGRVLLRDCR